MASPIFLLFSIIKEMIIKKGLLMKKYVKCAAAGILLAASLGFAAGEILNKVTVTDSKIEQAKHKLINQKQQEERTFVR